MHYEAHRKEGETMTQGTKDQIEGQLHQVKGDAKEKAGELLGDTELANEGKDENLSGKIQEKVGQIKKVFGS
jgi:uncharacterized protein YjbJ (UPF0337 family)